MQKMPSFPKSKLSQHPNHSLIMIDSNSKFNESNRPETKNSSQPLMEKKKKDRLSYRSSNLKDFSSEMALEKIKGIFVFNFKKMKLIKKRNLNMILKKRTK